MKETAGRVILHDNQKKCWLDFRDPLRIVAARRKEEVVPLLQEIEQAVEKDRLFAAGFIAYEAAPAFDPALVVVPDGTFPLVWFGLYEKHDLMDLSSEVRRAPIKTTEWTPSLTPSEYRKAIQQIKNHILDGRTYQVNFTYRLRSRFEDDPWSFFSCLVELQNPLYGAYVDTGEWIVCSASPELFFERNCGMVRMRPMKGTAGRGRTLAEDQGQSLKLGRSIKDRAENVMITDMVRNDLGRIASVGSVQADELFSVEKHPTVWQMTSSVRAETETDTCKLFQAVFPPASVTGAPKPMTMRIISELETEPRRVYTGCIGYLAPGRQAQFNVAIRTVLINRTKGEAEYGVGGGIVWDSTTTKEYEECRIKSLCLKSKNETFDLLETILWEPGKGFFLLDYHLKRLSDSAEYFSYPVNSEEVRGKLLSLESKLKPHVYKIRLQISKNGNISMETAEWSPDPSQLPVGLSAVPVDSTDVFLFHKTTRRRVYEEALNSRPGCGDVLLWNEKGELTESTVANLILETEEGLFTPPVSCGLLAGTYRAWMLDQGRVKEKTLAIDDLKRCRRAYLVNSVRKQCEIQVDLECPQILSQKRTRQ